MGHVDSGKTSLVRALSTVLSTAALDKHPQSRARGITLDLGFSSFVIDPPPQIAAADPSITAVQFTLVDCPGHASLIRTIIGGAQIIDMVVLVVDAAKGVQTQTAECLVIGEITTDNLVVVLNKVDLLPSLVASGKKATSPEELLEVVKTKVRKVLSSTKFADAPMVCLSAAPGGAGKSGAGGDDEASAAAGRADVSELVSLLVSRVRAPVRSAEGGLLMAVDHCFPVKGQGTVMTGTVLRGELRVGDEVELPALGERRKVKSIQMFHKAVACARQGDRAGFAVSSLPADKVERAIVCAPGGIVPVRVAVALVRKIRFFKGDLLSGPSKFHLTVGHHTVMCSAIFFGAHEVMKALGGKAPEDPPVGVMDWKDEFVWQNELLSAKAFHKWEMSLSAAPDDDKPRVAPWQFALLKLDTPVWCPPNALIIGSRLDTDSDDSGCRLALQGQLVDVPDTAPPSVAAASASSAAPSTTDSLYSSTLHSLKIYREAFKEGTVERIVSSDAGTTVTVCKSMFGKSSDVSRFLHMQVRSAGGVVGTFDGAFGKSGKSRVTFRGGSVAEGEAVRLVLRKYVFDTDKRAIHQ
jgi:selenocysteine-specific elongation factor